MSRKELVCGQGVFTGVTKDEFLHILRRPDKVNRTTNALGVSEQWVYGELGAQYYCFENEKLTAWQD